jgi:hypothetical protein
MSSVRVKTYTKKNWASYIIGKRPPEYPWNILVNAVYIDSKEILESN